MKDAFPVAPAMDLPQVVSAHQPDEARARIARHQPRQGRRREARAEAGLQGGRQDVRIAGATLGAGQSVAQAGHALGRLERVLRADQPPDLMQAEAFARVVRNEHVAAMSGVERPAQEADAQPGPEGAAAQVRPGVPQGRTCPAPRTTYL